MKVKLLTIANTLAGLILVGWGLGLIIFTVTTLPGLITYFDNAFFNNPSVSQSALVGIKFIPSWFLLTDMAFSLTVIFKGIMLMGRGRRENSHEEG